MSKRLTDSEVWKKPWFYDLDDKMKLFWFYILSDCDAAGIWTANFKIVEAYIGKVDKQKAAKQLDGQIIILNSGTYWFIKDFILFQYGYPLNPAHTLYKKITFLLSQRNIDIKNLYNTVSDTVCNTVCNTVKEEEEEIKEEKEEEKGKELQPANSVEEIRKQNFNTCKAIWFAFYKRVTNLSYNFTAADAGSLSSLVKKITFSIEDTGQQATPDNIATSFQTLLEKLPKWYRDKLDLKIINSNYNSIISQLKTDTGQSQVEYFTQKFQESCKSL